MIQLSQNITLEPITIYTSDVLYGLMKEIYPQAYNYFWKDSGDWYINAQYNKENVLKELLEDNASYFFVLYQGKRIGNFRIIWNEELPDLETVKTVKLHRIYLHNKVQGKGVGKQLLLWLETTAKEKQYELIWLDAMNEKTQAFEFYKKLGYQYHSHCFLNFELLYDKYRQMSQLYKKLN
ncbi:GNAT family N-acetyltransferase [Tenacibaculum amylolyticum]|uniref:GNAT family N-acetyltransferase n=1 Tax=Tenacibaculum amylolyticum TaxID=104269 RepID=UPI003893DA59